MASIDIPPPPYTETDIYSASSESGSRRASSLRPDDSVSRGAARNLSTASTTSSTSEIIYTPPETPQTSQFNTLNTADHIPASSAAAYFSSRSPWPYLVTDCHLTHSITIRRDTTPDDVPYPPYPQILGSRDVQHQDWKTFLNYLLPNHTSESNSAIIDRKLREEGDDVRSQVASDHLGGKRSKSKSPRDAEEWKEHARATVREWNEGFFHPRGIDIILNLPGEAREPDIQVPGAWRSSYDQRQDSPALLGRRGGRLGGLLGRLTAAVTAPENYNNGEINNQRDARGGLRLGSVVIGEDGVSIGNRFAADGNGLRIGGWTAAGRGRGPPSCVPSGPFGGPRGDWRREGRGGPFGLAGPFAGVRGPAQFASRYDAPGYDGGRGRGRGHRHDGDEKGKGRHRSRSSSSSSSSSSCSSSSSAESVGSLPAYEDLNDNQLPLTRDFLQKWLDHPDQPVTKESLKQVKANLKAASKTRSPSSASTQIDRAALRKEVRALMGEWKALRKSQKKDRRATKRERRETRRAAKRERRETRREGKRERRQARREARRGPPTTAAWPGRGGFLDRFGEAGYASVGRANLGRPSSHREGVVINRAVDDHETELALLERQIAEKGRQLVQVHEEITREQEEGVKGRESVKGEEKRMSPAVRKALELEREIDLAVRRLEIVRAENDERLAREMAGLEIKRGR